MTNFFCNVFFLILQEISVEDRKRQLENANSELTDLEGRIEITGANLKLLDKKLGDIQKKRKKAQAELLTHSNGGVLAQNKGTVSKVHPAKISHGYDLGVVIPA